MNTCRNCGVFIWGADTFCSSSCEGYWEEEAVKGKALPNKEQAKAEATKESRTKYCPLIQSNCVGDKCVAHGVNYDVDVFGDDYLLASQCTHFNSLLSKPYKYEPEEESDG